MGETVHYVVLNVLLVHSTSDNSPQDTHKVSTTTYTHHNGLCECTSSYITAVLPHNTSKHYHRLCSI